MDGGFVHERVTLDRLETIALSIGALTQRQVRTSGGGYVDLLIERSTLRIAVEAELTPRRIANDLTKAMDLAADELWIVVPNVAVAASVRAALDRMSVRHGRRGVFVLTLGQTTQWLTDCISKNSGSLSHPENKKTNRPRRRRGPRECQPWRYGGTT